VNRSASGSEIVKFPGLFIILVITFWPIFIEASPPVKVLDPATSSTPQPTQEESIPVEDLSKTVGFCMGQRFTLERIKKAFPDLALQTQRSMLEFKASYGVAEENIKKVLQSMLKKQYSEYLLKMQKQIKSILSSQAFTRQDAINFLSLVDLRSKGQIPSPILETLLTYQFIDNPTEEITRGYIRVFRTKDHPKAKGCDIQISYPASWRAKEGERPNIVQKFISQNGHGLESMILMVKDFPPSYKPSQKELDEIFSGKESNQIVPEGAKVISAKPILLDNHKGAMVIFDLTGQRLDMTIKVRSLYFVTVSDNK